MANVKNDHRSKFYNWKEGAWKNQGFNRIRTRDLHNTGAILYQLSYEATHWKRGQFIEFISPVRSEMVSRRSRVRIPLKPWFFRLPLSNCWKIGKFTAMIILLFDLQPQFKYINYIWITSFLYIWIISYMLHITSLLTGDMNSINWPRSQCVAS